MPCLAQYLLLPLALLFAAWTAFRLPQLALAAHVAHFAPAIGFVAIGKVIARNGACTDALMADAFFGAPLLAPVPNMAQMLPLLRLAQTLPQRGKPAVCNGVFNEQKIVETLKILVGKRQNF